MWVVHPFSPGGSVGPRPLWTLLDLMLDGFNICRASAVLGPVGSYFVFRHLDYTSGLHRQDHAPTIFFPSRHDAVTLLLPRPGQTGILQSGSLLAWRLRQFSRLLQLFSEKRILRSHTCHCCFVLSVTNKRDFESLLLRNLTVMLQQSRKQTVSETEHTRNCHYVDKNAASKKKVASNK